MNESTATKSLADELRATTKWIVAGAVGLGSALIALLPPLFPTSKEVSNGRLLAVVAGSLTALGCLTAIIWAASRVLGPRPTTVRDLVDLMDRRSTRPATKKLVDGLNRSKIELMPPGVGSVRRFWEAMFREELSGAEVDRHATKVVSYADDELTSHYFRSMLTVLLLFGPLAAGGVSLVTGALATAPQVLQLSWREDPMLVTIRARDSKALPGCKGADVAVSGTILAVSERDARYLLVTQATKDCPSSGVVVDAQEVPPSPVTVSTP